MKLTIEHRFVRSTDEIDSLVEARLCSLAERGRIDEAVVRLEERPETSPPFRVHAHLVTPGPDLTAEAVDHSLAAAVLKVVKHLNAALDERERNQAGRNRRNRSTPPITLAAADGTTPVLS